ncbi:MAG: hypothetical protein NTNFB02_20540 [Nitrospira sp.]
MQSMNGPANIDVTRETRDTVARRNGARIAARLNLERRPKEEPWQLTAWKTNRTLEPSGKPGSLRVDETTLSA